MRQVVGRFGGVETYFVKGSSVAEAAFEDLVYGPLRLLPIAVASRISQDAQHRPTLDTVLVLQLEPIVATLEFAGESTIAAETGGSDLGTRMMAKIRPIHQETTVVEPVDHLMAECILQMRLRVDAVGAEKDGGVRCGFGG